MTDSTTRVRIAPDRGPSSDAGFLVLTRSSTPGGVGRVFRIAGGGEAVIGRGSDVQLQIEDDGISRRHVRVFTGPDGRYWLEDLQSTNGTYLNGVRTRTAGLEEGDQIQIGSATALRFSFKPSLAEAEENLRRALAASQVATFSWDLQTEALTWSEQADQVCRAPLRERAKTAPQFIELVHPQDQELIRAALRRAVDERVPFDVEYRFQASGPATTWLASRGDVLRDDRDVPLRVVGTLMDISERKLVEQELRRHALLFESFDDAVVLVSREGTVLDWNSSAERMFGHSKPEALGRPYAQLLGLTEPEDLVSGARFSALTERWSGEQRIPRGPTGETYCETVMVPLRSPEGQYLAAVAVHRDVTQQRKMQSQLMVASRLASVGTLAAGVAHEINNPLAFVSANLEYLSSRMAALFGPKGEAHKEEFRKLLDETREGTDRIARVVRDLRTFSRVDVEGQTTSVDLKPALEFALQMTQNSLRHRAKLVRDLRAVPPVQGNASRLGQVFLHLLMNAAESIPEGSSGEHRVRVACFTGANGQAVVEVEDSGVGIAPEIRDKIFDPFFTTKPIGSGPGLGLAICHAIVKASHGEIAVESELGRGSLFRVQLPASAARPEAAAPPAKRGAAGRKRPRILVIDDEPLVTAAVERLLRATYEVSVAHEVGEALAQVREGRKFDAILSDLMMPGETGEELYNKLRELEPALAGRVVFMSGGVFTDRAQAFLNRIENPLISKPLDLEELREALARVIPSA